VPEVSVTLLNARQRKLANNACAALEQGNLHYAAEACAEILVLSPGCLPVRRIQRVARLRQHSAKNHFITAARVRLSSIPSLFQARGKAPAQRLEIAEKILAADPLSVFGLKILAESARALGLAETAVFALEAVREIRPDDCANLLALGDAWLELGKPEEASRVARLALRAAPADPDAQDLMRRASIAETMAKGNWETSASFRDKLKRADKSESSEWTVATPSGAEETQCLIDKTISRIAEEPADLNQYQILAGIFRRLGRTESALVWTRKARQLPEAAGNAMLENQELELRALLLESRMKHERVAAQMTSEKR